MASHHVVIIVLFVTDVFLRWIITAYGLSTKNQVDTYLQPFLACECGPENVHSQNMRNPKPPLPSCYYFLLLSLLLCYIP
uniref:Uncharacterized protein isoform X2 n=1 Tax=Nicotiana tabacum TaxID=4097 RepID=A0A1S3Z760_TOBAC|nr:PREDICTED: uncharacterized protein LOC107783804 isoform X2 [Nicotiana tabacum]